MKASCLQENLHRGLSIVGRAVSTKAQLPILGNILIATEQGKLKLSSTNLETGINFWLGAKVEKEGSLTVPARVLMELISSLPAEKIILESTEGILKVTCGMHESTMNGLSAREFPILSLSSQKEGPSFSQEILKEAISQVAFAAAQDEGRPVLTGVRWLQEGEHLVLAATDGYRLSTKKLTIKKGLFEKPLIVSARALLEVAHVSSEKTEEDKREIKTVVLDEENQMGFSFKDTEIITRLIEGEFPDFSKIIPQGFTLRVVLDREILLKGIKIASIFARDAANIIKWRIGEGRVTLTANSPQVGENSSEIEAKTEGEDVEIAFNFRFLLDFLTAAKGDKIVFETSGPLNPGVFRLDGDDSFLHIIMPVRVQG